MLRFIGINEEQLPVLFSSGVKVGIVKKDVSKELGFINETVVVSGGMDQACGCVGTGNISPGIVTENTGSSLNISVTTCKPVFDPKRRVPCQTHAIPGAYIYLPWCKTAGMVLKWFRDKYCEHQIKQAESEGKDPYEVLTRGINNIPPGSDGLVVLPHLTGAMSPEMDSDALGVFFGLKLSTTRDHLVKAIFESIAYMSRSNIELIEEAGIKVKEIILSGGASRNRDWNQIKSDVMGKKAKTIKNQDSGCLGAAILAGAGSGVYNSIEEACRLIIKDDEHYMADKKKKAVYDRYYDIYLNLYDNLKPVFKKLAHIEN